MSGSKKKGRTRVSIGTPTKLNGHRPSNELCSPPGSSSGPPLGWSTCCSACHVLVLKQSETLTDQCCLDSDRQACCIRDGCLVGAEWCPSDPTHPHPAVGGGLRPPRWSCVCVLARETLLALRLFCGDWVLLQARDSSIGWKTTARVWSPPLHSPANRHYQLALSSFLLTGNSSLVLPDSEAENEHLATLVPVVGRCVPSRCVCVVVQPCSTCDAVSFVGQARFRNYIRHALSGFVVSVGCSYRLDYLGSCLRVNITDVKVEEKDSCSVNGADTALPPIDKQMSSLSLIHAKSHGESLTVFGIIADDTEVRVSASEQADSVSTPTLTHHADVQIFGADSVLSYMHRIMQCSALAYSRATKASSLSSSTSPAASPLLAPSGVLVFGISGCGKSTLGSWLTARYSCVSVSCSQLVTAVDSAAGGDQLREQLELVLKAARARLPVQGACVVFMDDVDAVAPVSGSSGGGERRAHGLALVLSFVDAVRAEPGLALVATAVRPEDVSAQLRRSGRLDCELELSPPNRAARRQILAQLLGESARHFSESQLSELAAMAHGFVGADLKAALLEATISCDSAVSDPPSDPAASGERGSSSDAANFARLRVAVRRVRPSALRQLLVEVPHVRWADIAGQHELKLRLKQAVEWPLKHGAAFRRLGIRAPRGLLMYGPPGCSKTMIARALATESGLNFVAVKGPELFSKWVGESERAVRSLFARARQAAPSVVFIDELDALAVRRAESGAGGGGHSVGERVLAQLLVEMDGVGVSAGDGGERGDIMQRHVMVVAATNRPDLLDPALLRPGRLDSLIHVPLPDLETRSQLLTLRLSRVPLAEDVNQEWLAERTEGYSGAEIVAVCQEAGIRALQRAGDEAFIAHMDFCGALDTVLPRVTDYHRVYEHFQNCKR